MESDVRREDGAATEPVMLLVPTGMRDENSCVTQSSQQRSVTYKISQKQKNSQNVVA